MNKIESPEKNISNKKSMRTILFRQKNKMGLKKLYQSQKILEKEKILVSNEKRISISGIKKQEAEKKTQNFNEIADHVKTVNSLKNFLRMFILY